MARSAGSLYFRCSFLYLLFQLSNGCQDSSVGIADNSIIPDASFTATSHYDDRYKPKNARLNAAIRGWGPKTNSDSNDYLQIDLGQVFVICAIATQGSDGRDEWTTEYSISTSVDNTAWSMYKDGSAAKLFTGNKDQNTVVKNTLYYPVQARYVRFKPTAYKSWKVLRTEVYGIKKGLSCRSLPVGVGNGKIPDSDMTSSSTYNGTTSPSKARLNYTAGGSWCAATSDSSPYLQINLGSPHIICGIATQGDHMTDRWVQSYNTLTSTEGSTFIQYTENSLVKTFNGGFDSNTIVQNVLFGGALGQYVRIESNSHFGSTNCMRTELYGIQKTGGCSSMTLGLSYSSAIADHRFTASSFYDSRYKPNHGRLLASNAWAPRTVTGGDWLQIDLGCLVYVCAVATQGGGTFTDETVTSYKIRVSLDNVNWNYYQENNIDKVFTGNQERYSVVKNAITNPTKAKFIRFYPLAYNNWQTMRAEVYGIESACSVPLGVEIGGVLHDSQMTSSSHSNNTHNASHGRLYGDKSWCSNTPSNTEYLHINLGQIMTVTGVATQGDHTSAKWVMTYTIRYSMDGSVWNTYKAGLNNAKVIQGNADSNSVVVRWLTHPYSAKHVRITPQTWNSSICMRIELYGCNYVTRPAITGLTQQLLTASANSYVDLVCIVHEPLIQYIKWFTGNTDITSRSSGLVRGVNTVKSTLRVNYTSADDVINTHSCERSISVVCRKPFACRAKYKNLNTNADAVRSTGVTIILDYPSTLDTPRVEKITSSSVTAKWTQSVLTPSQATVTSYVLKCYGKNSTITRLIHVLAPALSLVITGLGAYGNYSILVKAVSGAGHGKWSRPKNFTTETALPVALPKVIQITALTSQSLRVAWQSPTAGINGPLLGYKIIYSPAVRNAGERKTVIIRGRQVSHTISNLKIWTIYRIKINLFNDKGDGPQSRAYVVRTLEDAPTQAPKQLQVTVLSSTSVQLSWRTPPKDSHNGIIRGFKIHYQSSSGQSLTKVISGNNISQCVVDSLDKYTSYRFKVLAYTIRNGPYTRSITAVTDQDAPSPPLNLRASLIAPNATRGPNVLLTWNRPASPNGIIKGYKVSFSNNKNPSVLSISSVEGSDLKALIPVSDSLTYWFRVRGRTVKDGNDTTTIKVTIPIYAPSVPPSIDGVTKRAASQFFVSWQPIPRDKSNGPITKYEVMWTLIMRDDKPIKTISMKETTRTTAILDGLASCAIYNTSVRGYTSAGPGPYSKPLPFYTSPPVPPEDVSVAFRDKREVGLQWRNVKPLTADISHNTIYFLGAKPYNNTFIHRGTRLTSNPLTKFTVQRLYPGTQYEFWVSALSKCGEGKRSVKISTDTYVDAPPAPLIRTPLANFTSSITNVTIWPASDINGQIRAYQVIVQQLDGSSIDESKLTAYSTAKERGLLYYITAEVYPSTERLPRVLTIGNGKIFGKYENVELEGGKSYKLLLRALTQDAKKNLLPGPMAVIAKGTTKLTEGTKDRFSRKNSAGSAIHVVGYCILGFLVLAVLPLLLYIWRVRRRNRTLKAEKRLSQKPRADVVTFENGPAMEESKYTTDEMGPPPLPPRAIITDDVYEQIDQRPYDNSSDTHDQGATIQNNHACTAVDPEDSPNDAYPSPPAIDYEDYEEIDQGITGKTATAGIGFYYEDMDASTKGKPNHYVESNNNLSKDESKDEIPKSEYKDLHYYSNIGLKNYTDSYT